VVGERHRAGSRDRLGHDADELHPGLHPAARHSRPVFDRVRRSLPRRREAAQVHGLRRRADHAAMRRLAALVPVVTLFHGAVVGGADLVVLCPNALPTAVSRVGDEHRAATGVGFRLVTDTAGGLASHAAAGTAGDVIISTTPAVADLEAPGLPPPGTPPPGTGGGKRHGGTAENAPPPVPPSSWKKKHQHGRTKKNTTNIHKRRPHLY